MKNKSQELERILFHKKQKELITIELVNSGLFLDQEDYEELMEIKNRVLQLIDISLENSINKYLTN